MNILIDNYDSFSYNLYQLIGACAPDLKVVRNDKITVPEIIQMQPEHIFLSPGPGKPIDAGICEQLVLAADIPILGVCLGHQAICEAFGGVVAGAKQIMHGKTSTVTLDTTSILFTNMPRQIRAARYHSLAALRHTLPDCLQVIAHTADDEIMAVQHKQRPIFGVQFHPESILTPDGAVIIQNFLRYQKKGA